MSKALKNYVLFHVVGLSHRRLNSSKMNENWRKNKVVQILCLHPYGYSWFDGNTSAYHVKAEKKRKAKRNQGICLPKWSPKFRHQKLCCLFQKMANKKQIIYRLNRRELIVSRSLSRLVSPITKIWSEQKKNAAHLQKTHLIEISFVCFFFVCWLSGVRFRFKYFDRRLVNERFHFILIRNIVG